QHAAQAAAESAYQIALERYKAGLCNYLNVLTAETSVLKQRRLAVDLDARALDTQVALIGALGGAGYEWLVASHYEDTDNAYVEGNVIQVTPQISGTVIAITADNTDFVR